MTKCYEYEVEFDAHAGNAAGVYALLNEEHDTLYVGSTDCFFLRLGEHCKGRHITFPKSEIFKFVILAYEDDPEQRLMTEKYYFYLLQPKYGGRRFSKGYKNTNVLERGKRISLGRQGLLGPIDPCPSIEEPDEALEAELRHLDISHD